MKKIAIILGMLLAFLGVIAFSLPYMVNKSAISSQVLAIIKQATGVEPVVMGSVEVEIFPSPKVVISKVGIKNAPGANTPYIMQFQSIEVYPSKTQMFSSSPNISQIVLHDPLLELETMPDGTLNWLVAFSGTKSLYQSFFDLSKFKQLKIPDIQIINGTVHYIRSQKSKKVTYESVQGSFLHDAGKMQLGVSGLFRNIPVNFNASLVASENDAESPYALTIKALNHEISVSGALSQIGNKDNKNVQANGKLLCKTDDIFALAKLIEGGSENAPANDTKSAALPAVAFDISSQFSLTNDVSKWSDISIESSFIKAKANLKLDALSNTSNLSIAMDLLDLDTFKSSGISSLFMLKKDESEQRIGMGGKTQNEAMMELGKDEDLKISVNAKKIVVNQQELLDLDVQGGLSGAFIDINRAKITLPGDSQALFVGTVKQGFQGITFEGSIDSWGQDFTALMPLFQFDRAFFPSNDFKRFRLKSDQFVISPVETRIIDAKMQIEKMMAAGTIVANYESTLKVESKIAIAGANIDTFIAHDSTLFAMDEKQPVYLKIPSAISAWLKTRGGEFITRLSLQKYVLNNKVRDSADISFTITPSKFDLTKLASVYDDTNFDLGFSVENVPANPLPKYAVRLVADKLNIQTNASANASEPQTKAPLILPDSWSKQEIDVSWLDDMDIAFDFKISRLQYGTWLLNNFSAVGVAAERILKIELAKANIWNADLAAKGSLSGGKLPMLNLSFSLKGIAIEQLIQVTPLFSALSGKFNVSGALSSSGISPFFLASNMSGKVGIGGRDVLVNGFNLRGIVRSVSAVRSVADILNVVRLAFPGGDTLIDTVQGNFIIDKGKAQTLGIKLKTNESEGTVNSVLDLVNWKMDSSISFVLATLDAKRPPLLRLQFNGDMETPKRDLDTKSLEEFVALKTKEKYLQDIPAVPQ